jgi:predicted enzyme related to lactoylglutathione lyase
MPHTVSALVFYVADLDRTAAFYSDILDLQVERVGEGEESFLTATSGAVELVFFADPDVRPGGSPVVVFGLEGGIEEAVEALTRHGVEIVTPVTHAPDGGLTADFRDPNGYVLSYYQSPSAT